MRLFAIVAASLLLQLLVHHVPMLEMLFGTEPISLAQCVAWIALGSIPLIVLELGKIRWRTPTRRLQTNTGYSAL
jgi:Ca2+-transporting ATPase